MKPSTKIILEMAQKILDVARVILDEEPKPKKQSKTKKGSKKV